MWNSPIPERRWSGFRRKLRGAQAFASLQTFEEAQVLELTDGFSEHEAQTLGRLLARGNKSEIELFVRTHGPNPIFDPQRDLEVAVGVAKADVVRLEQEASPDAHGAI